MQLKSDGDSAGLRSTYTLAYTPNSRIHSKMEAGGRARDGVSEMLGWPSEPIAIETDASDGAPRDPRSTYDPSRVLALTFGSSVAPKTKNWAMSPPEAPSCSPAVVTGVVICCKMLASRSCDDGGAGGSRGVGSTGGAAGGSDLGSRQADIDGSAVTSASDADVDAVAASRRADALRSSQQSSR